MPNVVITNVSAYKVSGCTGSNLSLATFHFDADIQAYSINVLGVSHNTGVVADFLTMDIASLKFQSILDLKAKSVKELKQIDLNTNITAQIDSTELYQEGNNRINIYGKDMSGNWTLYDS